jgi:hypothetical protein
MEMAKSLAVSIKMCTFALQKRPNVRANLQQQMQKSVIIKM